MLQRPFMFENSQSSETVTVFLFATIGFPQKYNILTFINL